MSLLSGLKKVATISSTSLCLSITAIWISESKIEAQVVNADSFTHQSFTNLISNQRNKHSSWLTSNNNLQADPSPSNSPSETQNSHSLLFGFVFSGIVGTVIVWKVKFSSFGVIPSQALKLIYYRLPHYQNQLRITNLEAQLRLVEDKLSTQQQIEERINMFANHSEDVQQLQNRIEHIASELAGLQEKLQNTSDNLQQIENYQTSWRSQYSTESQQLQNRIEHIEGEFANLQIEERIDSLFTDRLEEIQQRLEDCLSRWRSQHSTKLQQFQDRIEHIENQPVVLQSEWRNTQKTLENLKLDQAIETINEKQEMVIDAFSDLETEVRKIETKVYESSSDETSTLISKLQNAEETIRSLKQEIVDHKNNITTLYRNYREPNAICVAEGSTSLEFNTVSDVLSEAKRQYDILEIFDSAKNSAKEASYRKCKQIYSAFKAIAEIGEEYFKHQKESTSMGNRLEEEFKKRGFSNNYRPTEHEATKNQYGKERVFSHRGQYVPMFRHLTFRNNGGLQIYFEFMQEQKKVIIGYCGKHLHTASRPK